MVDYSRFDKIDYDNYEGESSDKQSTFVNEVIPMPEKGKDGRIKFNFEGRTIYEWEQSLEEVNIYIKPPSGVTRQMIQCTISPHHLQVLLIYLESILCFVKYQKLFI